MLNAKDIHNIILALFLFYTFKLCSTFKVFFDFSYSKHVIITVCVKHVKPPCKLVPNKG